MSAAAKCLQKIVASKEHVIIYFFLALVIVGGLRHCWQSLFITQRYTISLDALCSEKIHADIEEYAHKNILKTIFNKHSLATLKSHFDFLGMVNARYISPGYLHLSLKTHNPIIRINDQHVMLENGAITQSTIFFQEVIQELPNILVDEKEPVTSKKFAFHLKQWFERCALDLFVHYTIRWIDQTHIQLHDKITPNFYIITHAEKNPSFPCLNHCNLIKNQLLTQATLKNQKDQKKWGIDIRFKNQFIVHSMHEGVA